MKSALLTTALMACVMQAQAQLPTYSVYDGDTIIVTEPHGSRVLHRVAKADAPELKQRFGPEAKAFTERLCLGHPIKFIPTGKLSHGRPVEHITCNGISLAEALVRSGFAWVDPKYADPIFDKNLYAMQAAAKDAKVGLWSTSTSVPPWLWRASVNARGACVVHEQNAFKVVKGVQQSCGPGEVP